MSYGLGYRIGYGRIGVEDIVRYRKYVCFWI